MAKTVVVTLTDDIDGSPADETYYFTYDGKSYEIDLSKKNKAAFDRAIGAYIQAGRLTGGRTRGVVRRAPGGAKTLFSSLDSEEKDRFRKWAKMPTARRIGDAKVQEWIDAGRP